MLLDTLVMATVDTLQVGALVCFMIIGIDVRITPSSV
jgi:hypothetical protein